MLLWDQEETITRDWCGYLKDFRHEDVASEPGVLQAAGAMVRREELGCFADSGNSGHKGTGAGKRKFVPVTILRHLTLPVRRLLVLSDSSCSFKVLISCRFS